MFLAALLANVKLEITPMTISGWMDKLILFSDTKEWRSDVSYRRDESSRRVTKAWLKGSRLHVTFMRHLVPGSNKSTQPEGRSALVMGRNERAGRNFLVNTWLDFWSEASVLEEDGVCAMMWTYWPPLNGFTLKWLILCGRNFTSVFKRLHCVS